ncbi:hypothetical protein THIOSC13_1760006 [uncultured Thiomicrorhabdus sp.]
MATVLVTGAAGFIGLYLTQAGDVPITYVDVEGLIADSGFKPSTSIEEGIGKFVDWYKYYYGAK